MFHRNISWVEKEFEIRKRSIGTHGAAKKYRIKRSNGTLSVLFDILPIRCSHGTKI